ncbi:MAG TPA: sigma-70 family RNA polymerase sigma factor [Kofleriaceae bacterium]|nr:sigma-70 family RNA polymerase sigma factor [Kofleriaceae bacterium]
MTTDVELVARCRRRDADAFGALVTRHQQLVFGVALARCQDPALAEDVAQEAFVAAWRDFDRLRDAERVGPWVAGIARNLAANAVRTRARRERIVIEPNAEVPTPEDAALEREDRELLQRALADIPEAHRETLVLFYLQGQAVAEIAGALSISEDLVKQRLSRGRQALRDSVADRVESALTRTRLKPAFRAGVIAALSTASARKAAAGKVIAVMSTQKIIGVVAGVLVVAGGAWWFAAHSKTEQQTAMKATETVANPAATPTVPSQPHAPSKLHVERLPDKNARATLLAAIRDAQTRKSAASSGTSASTSSTPPPALPGVDMDKEYIRGAVREIIPLLTECYAQGLERDPKLAGDVVVEFTIEGEPGVGGVIGSSAIDPKATSLGDDSVRECIQETMYAIKIDPPASGGTVTVRYPFAFAPAGEEPPPGPPR